MGATNKLGRIAASVGQLNGIEPHFTSSIDVPNGGVLFFLPSLLVSGLLSHCGKFFQLPSGYYRLDSIFIILAFMALARLKSMENLRRCAPGEWGKLLGLDRIPEVKTLRNKVGLLSENDNPSKWAAELSKDWLDDNSEHSGLFYIDGHVRVYTGYKTKLPKHYVSRQKLCLRATVDYWVNALDGQPFFLINKAVDPGLIKVLEEEIVPRLEKDMPNQPSKEQLSSVPFLHRFTLIFDREGYSPDLFLRMKEKNIACLSYHKYPGTDWPEEEFAAKKALLPSGNIVKIKLAERGTRLSNKLWVREIRKLTKSGHQTSIISTDYRSELTYVSLAMFSRWSQENFFKYMRQHYSIDRLVEYSTEKIPDTTEVVNPEYRQLSGEIRKKVGFLNRLKKKFAAITFDEEIEPKKTEKYQQKKAELREEILPLSEQVEHLKKKRRDIDKHITIDKLPKDERFTRLSTQSKYLIDTIKMVAYRAETAMANLLREKMSHPNEARTLLRSICNSEADLLPDTKAGTLTVRLHQIANHVSSETIRSLCEELNSTETVFPGTNLRMVYELLSKKKETTSF